MISKTKFAGSCILVVLWCVGLVTAEVTTMALYRLGEDDPGAVAGNIGNPTTQALGTTDSLERFGDPQYGSDTPLSASTLSMSFNGDDCYRTPGLTYDLGSDNWGIEGWVYSTDESNGGWAFCNGRYLIGQWGGQFLWHRNGQGNVASAPIVTNTWTHMALVRDNGVLTAYLNGLPLESTNRTDTWDVELAIGGRSFDGNERWKGLVDHVRLFTFAPGAFSVNDLSLGALSGKAKNPSPLHQQAAVPISTAKLTWTPGPTAQSHDVYFGTDQSAVTAATTADGEYKGTTTTSEFSTPTLAYSTTYYWRVDEIEPASPDDIVYKGNVWSFTTEKKPELLLAVLQGDVDNNCKVNLLDMEVIAFNWLLNLPDFPTNGYDPQQSAQDSNIINNIDFAVMANNWGKECITMETLLDETIDRDKLARFPQPEYQGLQYSSYNQASVPPTGSPGWYADGDGGGFIRTETINGKTEWVIMEHDGPGCITTLWTPFFYQDFNNRVGPHIKIYLDGSTTPVINEIFIELVTHNEWPSSYGSKPAKQNSFEFPEPFAGFTARAGDLYFPIPFGRSCKVTMDQKNFYFHLNYRAYPEGTPVKSFTMADYNAAAAKISQIGSTLQTAPSYTGPTELTINQDIAASASATLALPSGSNAVRHLEIILPNTPSAYRSTILEMTFDGEKTIWAPVGDFFGNTDQSSPRKPYNTWSRTVAADGTMICRWVMPYENSGQIKLINLASQPVNAQMIVRVGPWAWDDRSMHFHANWRIDNPVPGTPFLDWNFIDITGRGVFLSDTWVVLSPDTGWWGEGDEKIYIDDDYDVKRFPSHFGTGTEDYYGWAGGVNPTGEDEFSAPFISNIRNGNPSNPQGYNINTRCRVLDAIPFKTRLRFDMEASPGTGIRNNWNLLAYSVVTQWYARPGAVHNRPEQPANAAAAVLTVADIMAMQNALKGNIYLILGAIELENHPVWNKTSGLVADPEQINPTISPSRWSNGAQRLVQAAGVGDFVEFRFTEQFTAKNITVYIAGMCNYGIVRIIANGQAVGNDIDTYAALPNIVPAIDLGLIQPQSNAITLRFEIVGQNPASAGKYLGLDAVVLK